MFTKLQEEILENFANYSDKLFQLGVIRTDSFTGEIGEYFACHIYDLKKTDRVTKAVDGFCKNGKKYQIKSKVIAKNFNYSFSDLQASHFDFLVIVYFDKLYNPVKILKIPSRKIINDSLKITTSNVNAFEQFDITKINTPIKIRKAINDFAEAYDNLEINGIIRSRRIVGDIGEFYASNRLKLILSENKNDKGIDAKDEKGRTFEIKTRRVYESGRRTSETRRLNNLVGKSANYLIVVVIDRAFKCSGMWLIPMKNITNPKSANLGIVNNTDGVQNLIPSKILWLSSGKSFKGFDYKIANNNKKRLKNRSIPNTKSIKNEINIENESQLQNIQINSLTKNKNEIINILKWAALIILLLIIIERLIMK